MFRDERYLAKEIAKRILSNSGLRVKNAILGDTMSKIGFEDALVRYFGKDAPIFFAKPDIIVVAEDVKKWVDDWFLLAIELKYFKNPGNVEKFEKNLRNAFREIGQPLRYHLHGFDSAVLWHMFEEDVGIELVKSYGKMISEVVEKLRLPMVLFITKVLKEDSFLAFKPLELLSPCDWGYIFRWMLKVADQVRNPLVYDKDIVARRRALKTILKVP